MAEQATKKPFKTVDLVDFAMQGKPIRVNDAFGQLISDKVITSLASKKQEVATRIFSDKDQAIGQVSMDADNPEIQVADFSEPKQEPETIEVEA